MKTDKEKLKEIIEKAVKNGWKCYQSGGNDDMTDFVKTNIDEFVKNLMDIPSYFTILFAHDFAKAYFNGVEGLGVASDDFQTKQGKLGWQYHLQQAVLSENPINYYYEHL